jgi:hypothetical protein
MRRPAPSDHYLDRDPAARYLDFGGSLSRFRSLDAITISIATWRRAALSRFRSLCELLSRCATRRRSALSRFRSLCEHYLDRDPAAIGAISISLAMRALSRSRPGGERRYLDFARYASTISIATWRRAALSRFRSLCEHYLDRDPAACGAISISLAMRALSRSRSGGERRYLDFARYASTISIATRRRTALSRFRSLCDHYLDRDPAAIGGISISLAATARGGKSSEQPSATEWLTRASLRRAWRTAPHVRQCEGTLPRQVSRLPCRGVQSGVGASLPGAVAAAGGRRATLTDAQNMKTGVPMGTRG